MMRILFILFLLIGSICTSAQEATETPDPPTLHLLPFTLENTGLTGIVPADWQPLVAGTAVQDDTTYLVHLHIADALEEDALLPLLATMNLEQLPEASTTISGQVFTWTAYELIYQPEGSDSELAVALAVSTRGDDSIVIALQTTPEQYAELHAELFLLALDVFGMPLAELREYLQFPPLDVLEIAPFYIRTLAPTGWTMVNPGAFLRALTPEDITTLLIQSSPDLSAEDFVGLLLQQLNLDVDIPEEPETFDGEMLSWQLFEIRLDMQSIETVLHIAFTEDEERSYLVAVFANAEESDELRAGIFLPVLTETLPLE